MDPRRCRRIRDGGPGPGLALPEDNPPCRDLLRTHLSFRSIWFRNALRGAIGLALAVAVVEITDVEHGFWVVLGTLSVLRSNALGTGATALRAIAGTVVGFVIGSLILIALGNHDVLLWAVLPLAVLVAGIAPTMISFAAGQAGFTVTVVILFNIIVPTGWKVGLTRVEDVVLGCAVSVVVGLLFWPRGAVTALGRALADAFAASSDYLGAAVERIAEPGRATDIEARRTAAQSEYLRLDDAFRQYVWERGAKTTPMEAVSDLFTGAGRLHLAAFQLAILPEVPAEAGPPVPAVAEAGTALEGSCDDSRAWLVAIGELFRGDRGDLGSLAPTDEHLKPLLIRAFDDARRAGRADLVRVVLRMLWAAEVLDDGRALSGDLARSAELFGRRHPADLA